MRSVLELVKDSPDGIIKQNTNCTTHRAALRNLGILYVCAPSPQADASPPPAYSHNSWSLIKLTSP